MKRCQFSSLEPILLAGWGIILAILFTYGVYIHRRPAVAAMFALAIWALATARASRFSLLERLMITLYVMPFLIMITYFFDPDYIWESTPIRVKLLADPTIIRQTLSIGLIGLVGLVAGMKMAESLQPRRVLVASVGGRATCLDTLLDRYTHKVESLNMLVFFTLLVLSMTLLFLMNNDSHTIFSDTYRGTSGWAMKVNFSGAGLVSYLFFILLFIDAERDKSYFRGFKFLSALLAIGFSILYFELVRGNRDAIGLIAALMGLYLTGDAAPVLNYLKEKFGVIKSDNKRLRKMFVPALVILVIYVAITPLRTRLSRSRTHLSVSDVVVEGFLEQSTWTSILLTNVGSAYFYSMGDIEYLYGQTYLDYLLSLPPGVLTQSLDYERPLERWQNPNCWFHRIGRGGIHPVIVPFHNFGVFGVLVIMAIIGIFIVWVDNPNRSTQRRFLYAGVISGSFKWFWYGDMTIIRVTMGVAMLWVFYRVLLRLGRRFA